MSFVFNPAKRVNVGLLIGLAGSSGAGKTFTALRLATGLAGGKRFAVLDTESGRAKHYADQFAFDHGDLGAPFRPDRYREAIEAAVAAGYPVIVVDSISHEQAGDGGLNDWHEEELDRLAGNDWKKRESVNMLGWVKPKVSHKKLMQKLTQLPPSVHLILCMRAEAKVEVVRDEKTGKMAVVPKKSPTGLDGWIPVCEKTVPYELTASFLLVADEPGVPRPIKLQEQHRPFFPAGKQITEEMGKKLGVWAAGGEAPKAGEPPKAEEKPVAVIAAELVAEYDRVETDAEFNKLEDRRRAIWATTKREQKEALATAKSHAVDRIEAMRGAV